MPILCQMPVPVASVQQRIGLGPPSKCRGSRPRAPPVSIQPHAVYIIAYELDLPRERAGSNPTLLDSLQRPHSSTVIAWTLAFVERRVDSFLCIPTVCPSKGIWRQGCWELDMNQTGRKILLVVKVANPWDLTWFESTPMLEKAIDEQHEVGDGCESRHDMSGTRKEVVRLLEVLGGRTNEGENDLAAELEGLEQTLRHGQQPVEISIELFYDVWAEEKEAAYWRRQKEREREAFEHFFV